MERLHPRVRIVWVVAAVSRVLVMGAILVGGAVWVARTGIWPGAPDWLVPAALGLALALGVIRVVVAWLRYGIWRFQVGEESLYIERGVFTRVKTVVPYVRVQHVDSRRSPLERATGLATVVVYTAGSRSADVAIPGLTPSRAQDLREELRDLAIENDGADAV
jgi:hypothetical protein